MGRIEELCQKFPEIPRAIIIKNDVLVEGVRYTTIMGQIGSWSLPDGTLAYDLGLDGIPHAKVGEVKGGWIEKPLLMMIKLFDEGALNWNYIPMIIPLNSASPYEIRYEGGGHYLLYRNGQSLEEVFFYPRPDWYSVKSKIDGKPLSTNILAFGDTWLCLISPNYCVYFDTGDECYFCPIGRTMDQFAEVGVELKKGVSLEALIEAFKPAYDEIKAKQGDHLNKVPCGQEGCRCIWVILSGGGMYDRSKEAERYVRYIEGLKKAMGGLPDVKFCLEVQALEEKDARRLHDVGLHAILYNLEVWDPELFKILCPGKAKYVGREHWLECLVKATSIYERGHVASTFVAGLEMTPPYGFKTVDEAVESTLGGMEWMVKHDIVPHFDTLMPSATTKMGTLGQVNVPPTDYFLELGLGLYKLLMKYNLYRPTPGLLCRQTACMRPSTDFARLRWRDKEYLERYNNSHYAEELTASTAL